VPLVSVQHQYLITTRFRRQAGLPTLRDPDRLTYYKEEVAGLVMGGYEPDPLPWAVDGFPQNFNFQLLQPDGTTSSRSSNSRWRACRRSSPPASRSSQRAREFHARRQFHPGPAPGIAGFFVGRGLQCVRHCIRRRRRQGARRGIVGGEAPFDVWPVDIRRFGAPHRESDWVRKRTLELYGKHYTIAWPAEGTSQRAAAPAAHRSTTGLKEQGAVFGEKLGWERPNWFAVAGEMAEDEYSFTRPNWFDAVAREHRATRERVALFDQTSFAKFRCSGATPQGIELDRGERCC